jgi:hypothetical protein
VPSNSPEPNWSESPIEDDSVSPNIRDVILFDSDGVIPNVKNIAQFRESRKAVGDETRTNSISIPM